MCRSSRSGTMLRNRLIHDHMFRGNLGGFPFMLQPDFCYYHFVISLSPLIVSLLHLHTTGALANKLPSVFFETIRGAGPVIRDVVLSV